MLVIWLFQLGLARADVNLSFLIPAGEFNYQTSPEDDKKAREIAKRVTERQNKCFDHLDTSYQTLCVNLDVEKRINLSAATLYCEHQLDRRSDKLPYLDENPNLRNYSAFVRSLDDDTFALFTNLFISVDSICFHATHEAQSTANINTMESIFRASEIAAVYIKDSSAKLRNITRGRTRKPCPMTFNVKTALLLHTAPFRAKRNNSDCEGTRRVWEAYQGDGSPKRRN